MPLQLLEYSSAFQANMVETGLLITGFASTNLVDREGEKVDPLEFDVLTFMNSPTLLRNHDYIADPSGNKLAAGSVKQAIPSYVYQEYDEDTWEVRSLGSEGEFVAYWPKHKSPKLNVGDRGLFVVAEVNHPMVVAEIERGEMGAFSWRGYSHSVKLPNGVTDLKSIDLVEISVVNIPAQNQSNFRVTSETDPSINMEVNLKDCDIYKMSFDKSVYSIAAIEEYTKKLDISDPSIYQNKNSYFVNVSDSGLVNEDQTFTLKVGDVDLVVAPRVKNKIMRREAQFLGKINSTLVNTESEMPNDLTDVVEQEAEVLAENGDTQEVEAVEVEKTEAVIADESNVEPEAQEEGTVEAEQLEVVEKSDDVEEKVEPVQLFVLDMETLFNHFPNVGTELQKSIEIEGIPSEIYSLEFPVLEAEKSESDVEADVEAVDSEKSEEVEVEAEIEDSVEPSELETVLKSVQGLAGLVQAQADQLTSHMKSLESFKDEVTSQIKDEVSESLKSINKTAEQVSSQKESIEKQLGAFDKIVPAQSPRDEKIDTSKSEGKSDPFALWKQIKN